MTIKNKILYLQMKKGWVMHQPPHYRRTLMMPSRLLPRILTETVCFRPQMGPLFFYLLSLNSF